MGTLKHEDVVNVCVGVWVVWRKGGVIVWVGEEEEGMRDTACV